MDDIVDEIINQVRSRQKRSFWGSLQSWFSDDSADNNNDGTDSERSAQRAISFARRRSSSRLSKSATSAGPSSRPTASFDAQTVS